MEALYPISDLKMEWRSAAGVGRRYELLSSRGVIAELEFGKKATKDAEARTMIHQWIIRPEGQLATRFAIRRSDSPAAPTTFRFNLARTKGLLAIPGTNMAFQFSSTNLFGTDWQWIDESGFGLIGLRQKGLSRMSAHLFLAGHATQHPFTPLLSLFGFYLLYLNHERQKVSETQASLDLQNLARPVSEARKRAQKRSALLIQQSQK